MPRCVRCKRHDSVPEYRPFCSRRCADADLGHWLTGSYAIPGAAQEIADDSPAIMPDDPDETH
jgi:endogenous inhibitor of DNA gyrase (YacG/DUF329 family)